MVHFLTKSDEPNELETHYLTVRRLEGRVLDDMGVLALPEVSSLNAKHKEWKWRSRTFRRFVNYLKGRYKSNICILDLGCGNGWMSNRMAENSAWDVWGVDVNMEELEQADRLFSRENLQFYFGQVSAGVLPELYFDVIVLAASIQYFSDFSQLIIALKRSLKQGGEIHIIDSPFYVNTEQQAKARLRTINYYEKMGVPEMAAFYHHHLRNDAIGAGAIDRNNNFPVMALQKLKYLAPFPWMVFKKPG
ncbi:MAG: class I SAM-dependent methyltransferase [Saprospiraceae bacterium]|nr:class I SAM-dependent methyltransferase [Saprospiraceae bacterium]